MKAFTVIALCLVSANAVPLDTHAKVVVVGNGNGNNGDHKPKPTAQGNSNNGPLCQGSLGRVAQCCKTDILGVADLDCLAPNGNPATIDSFKSSCAGDERSAMCCTVSTLGISVLCKKV